jgi:hypothetical protein
MINIIHICVFYVNIKVCMYHIVLKEIKYFTNIFIYYKYILFGLVLGGFQIWIDNIHILSIIHKIKKKKPLIWVYLSQ